MGSILFGLLVVAMLPLAFAATFAFMAVKGTQAPKDRAVDQPFQDSYQPMLMLTGRTARRS